MTMTERWVRWLVAGVAVASMTLACGRREPQRDPGWIAPSAGPASASASAASMSGGANFPELEHATNVLQSDRPFTSRAQAVTVSDQLALAADRQPEALSLRAAKVVGDLRRRAYRTFHVSADAREAIVQYERASKSEDGELACAARLAAITLRSEIEDQPGAAYEAIYEASRRDTEGRCDVGHRRVLHDLEAYRPEPGRLAEIDERTKAGVGADEAAGDKEATVVKPGPETKAGPARIESIETFSAREAARVVIHLTGPVMYDVGTIAGEEPRVYVDLQDTKRGKAARQSESEGPVRRVRVGAHASKTRVVLDLSQHAYRRVFYMPEPFRVVVDVSTAPPRREPWKELATGKRQIRRVVLDPGHGGEDPGAIGPGGLKEKDVTLDIAHRVAPILSRELGVVTMLTRDDDRYVSLEERAARANAFHADLFVSVHCNAAEEPEHRGVQTFVLARAQDEASLRLAARENAASAAAGTQVGAVLADLQVESISQQSLHFAELLQRATLASLSESYGDAPDGGVRSAAFFVLLGAQMPAALFEVSYISNPTEETRLATADYRQKLADGIANAIRAYRDGR